MEGTLLSQTGEKTQMGIFEEYGDVVHRPQKNVKDNVKESWKNRLLERDQLLRRCFLLNVIKINPTIQILRLMLYDLFRGGGQIELQTRAVKSAHVKITSTKAGGDKGNISWMDDEDLALSVKDWTKRTGESEYSCQ